MREKTTNDKNNESPPCVPVLVSQVVHKMNEGTQDEQQCAKGDKHNANVFFHVIVYLLIDSQIRHKITAFSPNHETFRQEFVVLPPKNFIPHKKQLILSN